MGGGGAGGGDGIMTFMVLFLQAVLKGYWKTNNAPLHNSRTTDKKLNIV